MKLKWLFYRIDIIYVNWASYNIWFSIENSIQFFSWQCLCLFFTSLTSAFLVFFILLLFLLGVHILSHDALEALGLSKNAILFLLKSSLLSGLGQSTQKQVTQHVLTHSSGRPRICSRHRRSRRHNSCSWLSSNSSWLSSSSWQNIRSRHNSNSRWHNKSSWHSNSSWHNSSSWHSSSGGSK